MFYLPIQIATSVFTTFALHDCNHPQIPKLHDRAREDWTNAHLSQRRMSPHVMYWSGKTCICPGVRIAQQTSFPLSWLRSLYNFQGINVIIHEVKEKEILWFRMCSFLQFPLLLILANILVHNFLRIALIEKIFPPLQDCILVIAINTSEIDCCILYYQL